jgi:3-hydroxybutyrate dehydrogenase
MTLRGRGAVITGGGQGIGAATARALAAAGARVLLAARTPERLEAVAREIRAAGGEAFAFPCDVTSEDGVEALAAEAAARLGEVDVLVNNAGVATSSPLHRQTLAEWEHVFAVNVTGTFLCTRAFLPGMAARGWGRVVNVASVAGLHGARYISAYSASKHAVVGFTRSVAAEAAGRGVTVNAVCPGFVDTPMTEQSVARIVDRTGKSAEEARAAILGTSPQLRLLEPEEVAEAVLYLCGHAARGITGQTLVLDGGALLS